MQAVPTPTEAATAQRSRRPWSAEAVWAFILVLPYLVVFLLFVVYPIGYGLWLARDPASYRRLFEDPIYTRTIKNTLIFLAAGVNIKLFLALVLSGFFFLPYRWIRWLGVFFMLPWAVPSIPTILSFRWFLNADFGMLNGQLFQLGLDPPLWLNRSSTALGAAITIHIWKWLPFWTLILLAGRMAISREVYDAAAVDGATGLRAFRHITFPMLRNLYLTSTLLSTIWTLGDFNSIYLLTGGGPADTTHVLATLGVRYAFLIGDIRTGVAVAVIALPLIIPLVAILVHRLGKEEQA